MAAPQTSSRLELLQARFQQRQLMEKEQKLLQLYDQQQQRAHQVAQRGSAGSNTSNGSGSGTNTQTVTRTTTTSHSNSQGGKVRQMFDERRQTTVKGIDRSYPLEPLENKPRKTTGPGAQKNGNTVSSRHSVTVKRTIRADANGNVNNGKPVINYHEAVTRDTFGPKIVHREDDLDEFYNENDLSEWNSTNQEPHTYGISGNDRARPAERTKFGITKKETSLKKKNETAPRKQESRTYRNMIKIQLGRESPEWRRASRESLRGTSKSPERNGQSGVRGVVEMQNSISTGNCKINENKRNISISSVGSCRNRSAQGIFNKSRSARGSRTSTREDTPSPQEKSKITEVKGGSVPRREWNWEALENVKEAGASPRGQSPIFRVVSKGDDIECESINRSKSSKFDSLKNSDKSRSSSPNLRSDSEFRCYPRRKSEFEKSRIFRKLQKELDQESPEDSEKFPNGDDAPLRKDKSPSPAKYNESFFRIKEYPRRTSEFEKSDTFVKLRNTFHTDEVRGRRSSGRSATPPVVVKSSYEKIIDSPSKRRNSRTTFHKLQEVLDRSSPDDRSSPIFRGIRDEFPKGKKSESEKSRIFRKLQMELSSSPEPAETSSPSPTRVSLKNDELEISNDFNAPRASFEQLKSVQLLKDHLLLTEKKNQSNRKLSLDDINEDLLPKKYQEGTPHRVIKKERPRSPPPQLEKLNSTHKITRVSKSARSSSPRSEARAFQEKSFSAASINECSPIASPILTGDFKNPENTYQRSDSVESALRTFTQIDNIVETRGKSRKLTSDSRRSSLHAATASWAMKTKSTNQHIHENVSTPRKTLKLSGKTKMKSLKASKGEKVAKKLERSPSPSCKKQLFTDSESDVASEGTRSSGKTITIENTSDMGKCWPVSGAAQQPLKILRSIEDIRNSMTRDNSGGKPIDESTNLISPNVTIRIISPTTARRTGYINQFVELGARKARVFSEINVKPARRIDKTPSPDNPRITSNETKSVSRNNSDVTSRPTSRGSNREKQLENPRSFDVVDFNEEQTRQNPSERTSLRKNSAFVVELEGEPRSKSILSVKKSSNDRQSPEKTSQSRQRVSNNRPASAISTNSSSSSNQGANSPASKSKMATKTRGVNSGNRTPSARSNILATDSRLPACKICGRSFASDRLSFHEQICIKTTQKKRKTFDPVVQRVKGTELEPFVKKMGKKGIDKKTKKSEVKSNWRRKHEDFINAIRSAKQMQAHLAAGGKLSDLPPPPASDTSDYIQCPHCGRKFNQGAAERHIPKCEHMLHNKPNPRAPPKPRR
ncbi:serine/arginine repetitive matrix protein 2 isoform X2 [Fopius arisanus]|uniref:Serine/arginine repetitive matrix protein 2 isoform X2 n=1 Tax=Fopius arisanus TaxID=64838 RepID=A0A9R1T5H6_9HYME|nr:PREDICTED: serine/arginine repetitive matrix protein 2-like isoform X2 [Fopius arisanus]